MSHTIVQTCLVCRTVNSCFSFTESHKRLCTHYVLRLEMTIRVFLAEICIIVLHLCTRSGTQGDIQSFP